MSRGNKRRRKRSQPAADEAKQALWRDREIERRLEREQDGAVERVKLREETLALYDEVRRRHAEKDKLESLGFSASGDGFLSSYGEREGFEATETGGSGLGSDESYDSLDSLRLDIPELNSYLTDGAPTVDRAPYIDSAPYIESVPVIESAPEIDIAPDGANDRVEMIEFDSYSTRGSSDDNDLDPFDIFKKKRKK